MASFYYSKIERDRSSIRSELTIESRSLKREQRHNKRFKREPLQDLDVQRSQPPNNDTSFRTKPPNSFDKTMTNDDVLGEEIPWARQNALRQFCYEALNLGSGGFRGRCTQFPGSHPVSLNKDNLQLIRQKYYYATWKADGTRYMMLITRDGVYLIDRSFNFRRVRMRFPCKPIKDFGYGDKIKTHHYTLLDGEMVIDTVLLPGLKEKKPERRYLVYDLMVINNVSVIDRPFHERWSMVEKQVIQPRNHERQSKTLNSYYGYDLEPFKVRRKDFWFLSTVPKLLKEFIPRQLTHDSDGVIFQGWDDPYVPRTHHGLLKWKYPEMNSVDFLFEIDGNGNKLLFLYERGKRKLMEGSKVVFKDGGGTGTILHDPASYSGKIIECCWDCEEQVWVLMRVRTDKDTPNEFNTYNKVMRSIRDNITEEVLLNEMRDIIRLPLYQLRIGDDSEAKQHKNSARASR
ncbi:mRNA capping enzyme, bifunctional [Parasponia andersonii]|uniref:mRNA guanylyltransferase n=1 Tax=Parasponia andersonii TaxID=3476 RepID=A0A2P5B0L3_PARAD|nr:mRNA capping enzyme, bifunctional [Parasponia andersonii]